MKRNLLFLTMFLFMFVLLIGCIPGDNNKDNIDFVSIDGIDYRLNSDKQSYSVVAYRGDNEEVIIQEKVNDLPVVKIGLNAFYQREMKSVKMPDTIEVIEFAAFQDCPRLEEVVFSKNLKEIQFYAFFECSSLKELSFPESLKEIGYRAFYRNVRLNKVEFKNKDLIINAEAFYSALELETVIIPDDIKYIGELAFAMSPWEKDLDDGLIYFGNYLYKYKGKIEVDEAVTIKDGTKAIGPKAFAYQDNLKKITMPNTVNHIYESAFSFTENLEEVELSNSLVEIRQLAFEDCKSLESIVIPKSVEKMGGSIFKGCENLTINVEAASKPEGWYQDWNFENLPVVWNYKK